MWICFTIDLSPVSHWALPADEKFYGQNKTSLKNNCSGQQSGYRMPSAFRSQPYDIKPATQNHESPECAKNAAALRKNLFLIGISSRADNLWSIFSKAFIMIDKYNSFS